MSDRVFHVISSGHEFIGEIDDESTGISEEYLQYIKSRLFIPKYAVQDKGIESMNIAAATAIVCSEFRRRGK